MATYRSYGQLKGNTLREGDIVSFNVKDRELNYVVKNKYLDFSDPWRNEAVFDELGLSKFDLAEKEYGYKPGRGGWPDFKTGDFEAATRLVLAIYRTCRKSLKQLLGE